LDLVRRVPRRRDGRFAAAFCPLRLNVSSGRDNIQELI
jgi:hypothetical protein